jgi:hypothetical protein
MVRVYQNEYLAHQTSTLLKGRPEYVPDFTSDYFSECDAYMTLFIPITVKGDQVFVAANACSGGMAVGLDNPHPAQRGLAPPDFIHIGRRNYTVKKTGHDAEFIGCYYFARVGEMDDGLEWVTPKTVFQSRLITSEVKVRLMSFLELLAIAGIKCVETSLEAGTIVGDPSEYEEPINVTSSCDP